MKKRISGFNTSSGKKVLISLKIKKYVIISDIGY